MKKYFLHIGIIIGGILFIQQVVFAAPVSTIFRNILPEANRTYDVGTTTPSAEWKNLYVQNATISGTLSPTGITASNTPLTFYNGTIAATSTNPLYVSALVATSTTVNSTVAGNLGIGTTTPADLLDVYKSSAAAGTILEVGVNDNVAYAPLALRRSRADSGTMGAGIGAAMGFQIFGATAFANAAVLIGGWENDQTNDTTARDGFFSVQTRLNNVIAEKMRITSDGNMGIGTTTPGALFSVHGNGLFSNTLSTANLIATGTVTFNTALTVANGGSGATTLTGLLIGNDTSAFTATTLSSGISGQLSDETGTGVMVFGTTPTFTTSALFPLGAVGAPGISFTGDTNNGIWSSGADTINFSTSGSEQMRINSSGNVGIGTTTPGFILDVYATGVPVVFTREFSSDILGYTLGLRANRVGATGGAGLATGIVLQAGNSIGTISSQADITSGWLSPTTAAETSYLEFSTKNSGTLAERVRINNAGRLGIGTTTPAWLLQIAGTRASTTISDTNAGANLKHWNLSSQGGNFYIASSTDLYATSSVEAVTILNAGQTGIGSSSPSAKLAVRAQNGETNLHVFSIASSTATLTTTLLAVDNVGHVMASGTPPALTSCGTSPSVIGNNFAGEVTVGSTATGCTVTFAKAYLIKPFCTVTPQTGSVTNTFSYTISTTAITVTETGLGGVLFDYICIGNTN